MIIENHHAPYAGITRIRFKGLSQVHPGLSAERTPALFKVIIALVRLCIEENTSRMEKLRKNSRTAESRSYGSNGNAEFEVQNKNFEKLRSWEIEKGR